jgi:hypothetical protein
MLLGDLDPEPSFDARNASLEHALPVEGLDDVEGSLVEVVSECCLSLCYGYVAGVLLSRLFINLVRHNGLEQEVKETHTLALATAGVAAAVELPAGSAFVTAVQPPKGPARAALRQRTTHASPLGPPVQVEPLHSGN